MIVSLFQGAEGHDSGAEWFVENSLDFLDAPNEFFYDKAPSHRRDCHSATPPSPFSRRFNRDDGGVPA